MSQEEKTPMRRDTTNAYALGVRDGYRAAAEAILFFLRDTQGGDVAAFVEKYIKPGPA